MTSPQHRPRIGCRAGTRTISLEPRSTLNTNTVWQVEGGLEFDMRQEWTGELYFVPRRVDTYNHAAGNMSLTRYRNLIGCPDYGRNAEISGNTERRSAAGFGAADITCTSGFYDTYFRAIEALGGLPHAVNATLQTRAQNQQDIWS